MLIRWNQRRNVLSSSYRAFLSFFFLLSVSLFDDVGVSNFIGAEECTERDPREKTGPHSNSRSRRFSGFHGNADSDETYVLQPCRITDQRGLSKNTLAECYRLSILAYLSSDSHNIPLVKLSYPIYPEYVVFLFPRNTRAPRDKHRRS